MSSRPICEPVELPPGTSVIADRVTVKRDSKDIGNFVHFHDVAELVLFRRVSGTFIAEGQSHPLQDGSVVFVPSMKHHDFLLDRSEMRWVLVQFDPDLVTNLGTASAFGRSFCVSPEAASRGRIDMLADWLVEAAVRADPLVERLTQLLLLAVADVDRDPSLVSPDPSPVERLLPALEMLRVAPERALTLEAAATSCRVSPAYFSRRFRNLFGMTFTEYARTYRLRLAARRLGGNAGSISEIAYGVGFSSPAHFTARFRERFGMTPREYRVSARTRAAG